MGAQHRRLRALRVERLHDLPPQHARGAHLGDLQIEVHADAPEEAQAPGELIHVQSLGQRGLHVLLAVGQGEGQFQRLVGAGFLHVVAGNADRVELGHLVRRVLDDVADDAHRRLRRVDVGVADHELLEDVVLDGAAQLVLRHALFLGGHHVAGQHRQHRAVHRHRDADLLQRNAVEQNLHVLDRVDRHAGLADVAGHPRVVRVIAAMGGQIEGHRHALAAGRQVAPVEGVRFLGGRETGVLANGPRPHRVHRRLRAAQVRRQAGQGVDVGQSLDIAPGVQRLDGDAVGSLPVQLGDIAARRRLGGGLGPEVKLRRIGTFRGVGHGCLPRIGRSEIVRTVAAPAASVVAEADFELILKAGQRNSPGFPDQGNPPSPRAGSP